MGGDGPKSPATHFLRFDGNTGEIKLTKGRKADADHNISTISKFSGIVLDGFINSIGGGKMDANTRFSSSKGYGAQVPYDIRYEVPDGAVFKVTEYKGVKWTKNNELKPLGAAFQRNIYILLIKVDGKNLPEPVICQMDVKGLNSMQYAKTEPFGGRQNYFGWKVAVEQSTTIKDKQSITRKVQVFDFSEVDKTKAAAIFEKVYDAMGLVDPYIDSILAQKAGVEDDENGTTKPHPANNAGAEYNPGLDDDDDFTGDKVGGDVQLNKWGKPIYDEDGNELEYDAQGNLIDPPPF
jgi:hypothetical protein